MTLVEKIQKLCEERNTNVANLQKEMGFSNGTIYRWDKNLPSVDKVKKVAKYFGVSMDYLLDESEYEPTELFIPEDLKNIQFAFHRGGEGLTQEEVNALAVIVRNLKSKRQQ
jgi:transcriptional regulator with XRE-family HTH domain